MSKAPALDAIEPFTWCQAAIRWLLDGWKSLEQRLCSVRDPFGNWIIYGMLGVIFAPPFLLLLGVGAVISEWISLDLAVRVVLGSTALSAILLAETRHQSSLRKIGRLNYRQYALIQAVGEDDAGWKEQIIGWALEAKHLDDRHLACCVRAWQARYGTRSIPTTLETQACADDLFDGYVGMIRESWTRRRDLTQQMETGVQRNKHLPKL